MCMPASIELHSVSMFLLVSDFLFALILTAELCKDGSFFNFLRDFLLVLLTIVGKYLVCNRLINCAVVICYLPLPRTGSELGYI